MTALPPWLPGLAGVLLAGLLAAPSVLAGPLDTPSEQRPDLPSFEAPESGERLLPLVRPPDESSTSGLAAGRRFHVREYRIEGASVLSPDELAALTGPYRDREVGFADLEALRTRITDAYIERGYISSGALIPDQTVTDETVTIRVIEGRLVDVTVESDGRLRTGRIKRRLERAGGDAVNVFALEEQLQILQQERLIDAVDAELLPGSEPGETLLRVLLREAQPFSGRVGFANEENPTIGEYKGFAGVRYDDVTGFADALSFDYGQTEGFLELEGRYELPLNSYGTRLGADVRHSEAEIIEPRFESFDIETRSTTYGLNVGQELHRSLRSRVDAFLIGEVRRAKSQLLGQGFSFVPGPDRGRSHVSVLRLGTDWTWRGAKQVLAARSMFSLGVDLFDATMNPGSTPDGQFFAWLGQLQGAQRLPFLSSQLIARADVQLADSRLLALEQFAIGGMATVRGYREDEVVRDNGIVLSGELRVPVYTRPDGWFSLDLAPFMDWGTAWNTPRHARRRSETLWSVGIGTLVRIGRYGDLRFYWGHDIEHLRRDLRWSPQDDGLHFRATVRFP